MTAVVDVYTVAIAYLQVVEEIDAIDHRILAAYEMECPVSAFADGDVAHLHVLHTDEREDMRPGIKGGNGLQLVGVRQLTAHKAHAVAIDGAASTNSDVVGIFGPKP